MNIYFCRLLLSTHNFSDSFSSWFGTFQIIPGDWGSIPYFLRNDGAVIITVVECVCYSSKTSGVAEGGPGPPLAALWAML